MFLMLQQKGDGAIRRGEEHHATIFCNCVRELEINFERSLKVVKIIDFRGESSKYK